MKLKLILVLVAAVVVLWVGLLVAARMAEKYMNKGAHPPLADAIIQQIPDDSSDVLPDYWKVPAFSFVNQDGKRMTDRDLLGHVWVADFIFTQCTTACPIMTSKMLMLQKQVRQPNVRFVSFSVDPDHDTPAVLKKYEELWQGDAARWLLFSTNPKGLAAVVKGMRVTVQKTDDAENPITHSSLFMLVDAKDQVRGIYDSIDSDAITKLETDIDTLAGAEPPAIATPLLAAAGGTAVERGQHVYQSMGCLACHSQSRIAPALTEVFGGQVRLADHRTVWADEGYLHESIVNPAAKVVVGYLPTMPSYGPLLSDQQTSDVIAYIESISTNTTGGHGIVATSLVTTQPVELLVTDPVCKMEIHADATSPFAVYKGAKFYFCSQTCRDKFLKDPAHFAPVTAATAKK